MSNLFKNQLKQIILFGSYARGDYEEYSDLDIMILVDLKDEEIKQLTNGVIEISSNIGLENDIVISPIIKNINQFNSWLPVLPFYKNVVNEGVTVYG